MIIWSTGDEGTQSFENQNPLHLQEADHRTQEKTRTITGLMLVHHLQRSPSITPTLGQRILFDALFSLHFLCSLTQVKSRWSQQTQDIDTVLLQCWATVYDADPALKHQTRQIHINCISRALGAIIGKFRDIKNILIFLKHLHNCLSGV